MRDNDLYLKEGKHGEEHVADETDTRISVEECVKVIIEAADRKARKVINNILIYSKRSIFL